MNNGETNDGDVYLTRLTSDEICVLKSMNMIKCNFCDLQSTYTINRKTGHIILGLGFCCDYHIEYATKK